VVAGGGVTGTATRKTMEAEEEKWAAERGASRALPLSRDRSHDRGGVHINRENISRGLGKLENRQGN
jgi:hypothetical protein